jgi:large subunit ribosomal protein L21
VYAVIRSGGKQYRVAEGETLKVERDVLASLKDSQVTFSDVLLVGGDESKVGAPLVAGASVLATLVREERGEKVIVFKRKRRKQYKRKHGHRQDLVEVRIDRIQL